MTSLLRRLGAATLERLEALGRATIMWLSAVLRLPRAEDIPLLTRYLIDKHNALNASQIEIGQEALSSLENYSFPGNVRELENILERALALCEDDEIIVDDLQLPDVGLDTEQTQANLGDMTRDLEREQIETALNKNRWNQSAAARSLGLTLRQLRYRIEKLGLKP